MCIQATKKKLLTHSTHVNGTILHFAQPIRTQIDISAQCKEAVKRAVSTEQQHDVSSSCAQKRKKKFHQFFINGFDFK